MIENAMISCISDFTQDQGEIKYVDNIFNLDI